MTFEDALGCFISSLSQYSLSVRGLVEDKIVNVIAAHEADMRAKDIQIIKLEGWNYELKAEVYVLKNLDIEILSEEQYRAADDCTKIFECVLPYVHWHEDHWDACKHNREVAQLTGAHNSDIKGKDLRIAELEALVDKLEAQVGVGKEFVYKANVPRTSTIDEWIDANTPYATTDHDSIELLGLPSPDIGEEYVTSRHHRRLYLMKVELLISSSEEEFDTYRLTVRDTPYRCNIGV